MAQLTGCLTSDQLISLTVAPASKELVSSAQQSEANQTHQGYSDPIRYAPCEYYFCWFSHLSFPLRENRGYCLPQYPLAFSPKFPSTLDVSIAESKSLSTGGVFLELPPPSIGLDETPLFPDAGINFL